MLLLASSADAEIGCVAPSRATATRDVNSSVLLFLILFLIFISILSLNKLFC